jgi:DNA-binding transcriptional regulator YiaG
MSAVARLCRDRVRAGGVADRRSADAGGRGLKLVGMCAPADQLLFSGADVRCRRGALGLPEQDAAALLRTPVAALRAWEADAGPIAKLTAVMGRLASVEQLADRITTTLIADAAKTGRIVTFRTDIAATGAGAAMGVAALHRICAGRAREEHRDAQLVFHELDEGPAGQGSDRRAELMVRITVLALTRADITERLGVQRRRIQQWIRGDAAIPAGVFEDLDVLEHAADRHTERLEEAAAATGRVDVAATAADLLATYPGTEQVPLSTHWAAAGVLLADEDRLRALWITAPAHGEF